MTPDQVTALKADIMPESAAGQPLETRWLLATGKRRACCRSAAGAVDVWRPDAPTRRGYGAIVWRT